MRKRLISKILAVVFIFNVLSLPVNAEEPGTIETIEDTEETKELELIEASAESELIEASETIEVLAETEVFETADESIALRSSEVSVLVSEFKTTNDLYGFVTRMYTLVLGRQPDSTGYTNWTGQLKNGTAEGAKLISGFYNSSEYTLKNTNNSSFVENCYQTILNRNSDSTGKANWVEALEAGVSRNYILSGFVNSSEFANLCKSYGISKGSIILTEARDKNINTTKFVQRLYQNCLGRSADTSGLNNWTKAVNNGSKMAADLVVGFYLSKEYTNKKTSDVDFVESVYKTMLNRASDASGKVNWLNALSNSGSRKYILSRFVESNEFTNLCKQYGITKGSISIVGKYLGEFKLTAYCACSLCCGQWADGITASGTIATQGRTIAMAGVSLGTKLVVDGVIYTVEDRGTPYGHIDIFMNKHNECIQFGVKSAKVYMAN